MYDVRDTSNKTYKMPGPMEEQNLVLKPLPYWGLIFGSYAHLTPPQIYLISLFIYLLFFLFISILLFYLFRFFDKFSIYFNFL